MSDLPAPCVSATADLRRRFVPAAIEAFLAQSGQRRGAAHPGRRADPIRDLVPTIRASATSARRRAASWATSATASASSLAARSSSIGTTTTGTAATASRGRSRPWTRAEPSSAAWRTFRSSATTCRRPGTTCIAAARLGSMAPPSPIGAPSGAGGGSRRCGSARTRGSCSACRRAGSWRCRTTISWWCGSTPATPVPSGPRPACGAAAIPLRSGRACCPGPTRAGRLRAPRPSPTSTPASCTRSRSASSTSSATCAISIRDRPSCCTTAAPMAGCSTGGCHGRAGAWRSCRMPGR